MWCYVVLRWYSVGTPLPRFLTPSRKGAVRHAETMCQDFEQDKQLPWSLQHYFGQQIGSLVWNVKKWCFSGFHGFSSRLSLVPRMLWGRVGCVANFQFFLMSTWQHMLSARPETGFYFAFMQHLFSYGFGLSVLLAPLLAVYSVDWARHLVQAVAQDCDFERHVKAVWYRMVHACEWWSRWAVDEWTWKH